MLLNELQRQRQEFQQAFQEQQLEFQQELADLRAQVGQMRGAETLIPGTPIAFGEDRLGATVIEGTLEVSGSETLALKLQALFSATR